MRRQDFIFSFGCLREESVSNTPCISSPCTSTQQVDSDSVVCVCSCQRNFHFKRHSLLLSPLDKINLQVPSVEIHGKFLLRSYMFQGHHTFLNHTSSLTWDIDPHLPTPSPPHPLHRLLLYPSRFVPI